MLCLVFTYSLRLISSSPFELLYTSLKLILRLKLDKNTSLSFQRDNSFEIETSKRQISNDNKVFLDRNLQVGYLQVHINVRSYLRFEMY